MLNSFWICIDVNNRSQGLILAASLKAGQVSSSIALIEANCQTVTTRILIQSALRRFYAGNQTDANWVTAISDVQSALGSGGYVSLYQAKIFSRNEGGNQDGLLNVTTTSLAENIELPYSYDNGSVSITPFEVWSRVG
jgi:osomolarity two-component system sensor histidine kinase SLN1